ncbi:MAG: TIGR04438 family Trp-rich protein [Burkholderiales bacterium]|nr:TIGR04438 family Trp-rich protein [Burkholderiales bacterium]
MWFVAIGVLMLVMNFAGIGPVGAWTWGDHWWAFAAPFVAAIAWWGFADSTGWTQRKAMEKVDQKKEARRQQNLESLGLDEKSRAKRKQAESKS